MCKHDADGGSDTYTAQATVGDVNKGVVNHKVSISKAFLLNPRLTHFQNLESSDVSLLVFGNGDGGGGPLSKMLENVRSLSEQSSNTMDSYIGNSSAGFELLVIIPESCLRSTWATQ